MDLLTSSQVERLIYKESETALSMAHDATHDHLARPESPTEFLKTLDLNDCCDLDCRDMLDGCKNGQQIFSLADDYEIESILAESWYSSILFYALSESEFGSQLDDGSVLEACSDELCKNLIQDEDSGHTEDTENDEDGSDMENCLKAKSPDLTQGSISTLPRHSGPTSVRLSQENSQPSFTATSDEALDIETAADCNHRKEKFQAKKSTIDLDQPDPWSSAKLLVQVEISPVKRSVAQPTLETPTKRAAPCLTSVFGPSKHPHVSRPGQPRRQTSYASALISGTVKSPKISHEDKRPMVPLKKPLAPQSPRKSSSQIRKTSSSE
ncbi:hypothetical protein Cpir12675_000951 [Ceratocystis pirilliformis]|uniref:Uncharacterized protein n=1 Tax=Ceratocystis pirilliformis TaxID=259994 RepID=A0ABR3ZIY9_9PEZI